MSRTTHAVETADTAPVGGTVRRLPLRAVVLHVTVFGAGWLLLTGASISSLVIGIPTIVAATWVLRRGAPVAPAPISPAGVAQFVPFFLWQSARGGVDVALRTLAPRMRIRPGYITFRTQLAQSRSRVFFTYCVNLLPGTLTADLRGDQLTVHLLDTATNPDAELRRLEAHVARIFADDACPVSTATSERTHG